MSWSFCLLLAMSACASRLAAAEGMVFPGRQWAEAMPASQGVDAERLAYAIEYLKKCTGGDQVREMLIVVNGRVIFKGDNVDHVHGVWSVTKSFTSTVMGLLIAQGKCAAHTLAKEHVPAMGARYPKLTLRHFATMTSGYRAIGDEPKGSYTHGPSDTPFEPSEPLFDPGEKYAYWDSAMNQFGYVLTRIAGEPMEEVFRRQVAEPIGMNPRAWDWEDFGKVEGLVVNGGAGNQNRHVKISARELARFGHLWLNRGAWQGTRIIDEKWIEMATNVAVPAGMPWGHSASKIDGRGVYGLNWWVNGFKPDGKRMWPATPPGTFAAIGFNNNRCFVIPEWKMVVVRLGLDGNVGEEVWEGFFERLAAGMDRGTSRAPTAAIGVAALLP